MLKSQEEKLKLEDDLPQSTTTESPVRRTITSDHSQSSPIFPVEFQSEDSLNTSFINNNSNSLLTKDILSSDIIPIASNSSIELPCIDSNRERTLSDASSATVDYDFDTETCTVLTSKSFDNNV